MHGRTTGEDIFKEVEKTLTNYDLIWKCLKCITTDGGKMCGVGRGFVGQVYKAFDSMGCTKPIVCHCIIHQKALCGKHLDLSCVIEPVVSIVNFIRSHALNHRKYRTFLEEINAEYSDLLYHTAVRRFSSASQNISSISKKKKNKNVQMEEAAAEIFKNWSPKDLA
ncbi:general transcription factor II-I repeat domain-containing protein 2A-like [Tachypleus tridentatus]|uniref:general transcription factor II-I repeat domain-containing protein 2A-like n=1 Tax=Tachypleus tridentatus TaxID=6853 RepID=UPI003FD6741D